MLVEFDVDDLLFDHTLARVPDVSVTVDAIDVVPGDSYRSAVWVHGTELDAFEEAAAVDPSVSSLVTVACGDRSRLYSITHPGDVQGGVLQEAAVTRHAVLRTVYDVDEGWRIRMQFPDRQSFNGFRDDCNENGISLTIRAIGGEDDAPSGSTVLTPPQREALVVAADSGYFSIPREASLAEVADQLGVTPQATSERIRRAMASLVTSSLDRHPGNSEPRDR